MLKDGDKVKIEYTGTLEDGTEFDSSEKHGSLEFQIGAKQVIPGFEKAVSSLKIGKDKKITLQPSEAYGDPNPDLVKKVPKDQFPADQEVKVGMGLAIKLPNGSQIPGKITALDDKEITVDLNHPLAGKVLNFKIKLVSVESGDKKD